MEDKMIDFTFKKEMGSTQVKVNDKIKIENLEKILSVSSESIILSTEVLNGELEFSGEVCFVVVYVDNENKTKSTRNLTEFNGKITSENINAFISPIITSNIIDNAILQQSDNEVDVEALVEVNLSAFVTESFKRFEENNSITKLMPMNMYIISQRGDARTNLEETFDLKEKPVEILSVKAHLLQKNYSAGTGYITLDATLITQIVYTVDREDKTEMRSEILRRDIKEEIEVENMMKDYLIILNTDIKNCSINYEVENSQIKLNIPVDVKYVALKTEQTEIVEDAFSPTHEVELTYDTLIQINKIENYLTTERVDGMVEIDENETRIARLICNDSHRVLITGVMVKDKKVVVEGIAYENIIYQLDDDMGSVASLNAEIPFSITIDVPYIGATDNVNATVKIIDCINKLKKGRQIEVDMELGIYLNIIGQEPKPKIKQMILKEELNLNEGNFMIYFGKKDDTSWSVAKKLKINEDIVLMQNKDVVFPLKEDQTIVCYRRIMN